jgi:DNA-binding IclR family transcriptional regulator
MGYVEQATDLSYHLGFEIWALGIAATRHFVPQYIADLVAQISSETGESVVVMRRAGLEGVCIAFHEGSMLIKFISMRVGSRRPLGIGGLSVAILSSLDPDQARAIVEKNHAAYAAYGVAPELVRDLIELARERGYAYSEGIIVPESRSLAVPLPLDGLGSPTNMSMSILTTESRLREPRKTQLTEFLRHQASLLAPASRKEAIPAKRQAPPRRR